MALCTPTPKRASRADWSSLPEPALMAVASHLQLARHVSAFGAACSSWMEATRVDDAWTGACQEAGLLPPSSRRALVLHTREVRLSKICSAVDLQDLCVAYDLAIFANPEASNDLRSQLAARVTRHEANLCAPFVADALMAESGDLVAGVLGAQLEAEYCELALIRMAGAYRCDGHADAARQRDGQRTTLAQRVARKLVACHGLDLADLSRARCDSETSLHTTSIRESECGGACECATPPRSRKCEGTSAVSRVRARESSRPGAVSLQG